MNESLASASGKLARTSPGFQVTLPVKVRHGRVPAHASVLALLRRVSQSVAMPPNPSFQRTAYGGR